ncbi:MAG: hypothetical protein RLZZ587_936, partial [Actinomycetota bacterium]
TLHGDAARWVVAQAAESKKSPLDVVEKLIVAARKK